MANIKMDGIPVETVTTEEFVCVLASSQVLRPQRSCVWWSLALSVTMLNNLNYK